MTESKLGLYSNNPLHEDNHRYQYKYPVVHAIILPYCKVKELIVTPLDGLHE